MPASDSRQTGPGVQAGGSRNTSGTRPGRIPDQTKQKGWLTDFDYELNETDKTIRLTSYKGEETDVTVPATATVGTAKYATVIGTAYMEGGIWYAKRDKLTSVVFEDGVKLTSGSYLFYDCVNLTSVDLGGADTSEVTDMRRMFNGCRALQTVDLSGIDTSNVTDMSNMFASCVSLTALDLSGFNTSRVQYMDGMFRYCSSLTGLDLHGFDTSRVRSMSNMFYYCSALKELDLRGFDGSGVKYSSGPFNGCGSLKSVYTPVNLRRAVDLPYVMYDKATGNAYDKLPAGLPESLLLVTEDLLGA